jgi:hypothetical protein
MMNAPQQAKRKRFACALQTATGGKFMAAWVHSVALKGIVAGVAYHTRAHEWKQRTSSQIGLVEWHKRCCRRWVPVASADNR